MMLTIPQAMKDIKHVQHRTALERELEDKQPSAWMPDVYLIHNPTNSTVKIGVSKSPYQRLQSLQGATADKLELVAVIKGGPQKERELHQQFEEFKLRGEWFRSSFEIFLAFGAVV